MAGASASNEGGLFADINVTPLVDVTLVLLIIFMVAAPLIINNPSIKVELPKASTGDESQKTTVALTLTQKATGYQLYWNGEKTDEADVRTKLPGLVGQDRELQAIIAADKAIAYGDVMHIVDLVKALGVRRFALNTDPTP